MQTSETTRGKWPRETDTHHLFQPAERDDQEEGARRLHRDDEEAADQSDVEEVGQVDHLLDTRSVPDEMTRAQCVNGKKRWGRRMRWSYGLAAQSRRRQVEHPPSDYHVPQFADDRPDWNKRQLEG